MIEQKSAKKTWILILGVIWGIIEASMGWVFHLFHIHYLTPVLILAGLICMITAIVKTKDNAAAFQVASVASVLKLSNLFLLSYQPVSWVLAPVTHILLEGILVSIIGYIAGEFHLISNLRRILILIKQK